MWSQTARDFPVALQVLINKGDGTFTDVTETLNPDMKLMTAEMDYHPQFLDLDNSGIETLLFSGSLSVLSKSIIVSDSGRGMRTEGDTKKSLP